jgi:hypothetical protein
MQFSELVAALPGGAQQPVVLFSQGEAFEAEPNPVAGYVRPTFKVQDWPDAASVLLIEAPGAVGKSAAAAALASALSCPLVRAERAQVGSYTLSGLVQDALGFGSPYVADVANGQAALVVDSLDEAHIKAGTQNFLSFIENIQSVSGAPAAATRRPSVVLFSRTETADLVRLSFLDRGIPLAEASLDFFDRAGAQQFIDSYLELRHRESGRGEYTVNRASPIPFKRLRDARFAQLARTILREQEARLDRDWARAADFLGYTPVLIAVAESLAVLNPAREQTLLEGVTDPTLLLREIVNLILQREQGKLANQMAAQLMAHLPTGDAGSIAPEQLYTPHEQIMRIASLVLDTDLTVAPPTTVHQTVRDRYEQAAGQFIAEHPFVRNRKFASVVFQDHCCAFVSIDVASRASLLASPETKFETVGPFYTHFVNAEMHEADTRQVPESLLPWLMSSWTQDAELADSPAAELRLDYTEPEGRLLCLMAGPRGQEERFLEFNVRDISGVLHLRADCRRLTVLSTQGVILGKRGSHLSLGPDLIIVADEIALEAETVSVEPSEQVMSVALAARTALTANYLTNVTYARQSDLQIFGAEPPPRLRPFHSVLRYGGESIDYSEYVNLRAILLSFGASAHGGPSVFCEKLEQAVVKDNAHRRAVLSHLQDSGVINRDGALYRLDSNAMSDLRFSLRMSRISWNFGGDPG